MKLAVWTGVIFRWVYLKSRSFWRYSQDKLGGFCLLSIKPFSNKRLCVIAVHPELGSISSASCEIYLWSAWLLSMERKVILLILLAFLGIGSHSQMFYFLVYAIRICIHLVNNSELFVPPAKPVWMKVICVNGSVLVSFFRCMYSHETAEVNNQYVYYTSSKEAENLVEIT